MVFIKYSKAFIKKFGYLLDRYLPLRVKQTAYYNVFTRGKYRRVTLSKWLNQQVVNASPEMKVLAKKLKKRSHDRTALSVLRYVIQNTKYFTDIDSRWKVQEHWQEAQATLDIKEGDCEDGSILQFVLCRLAGIPSERLWLRTGWGVKDSGEKIGHAWFTYTTARGKEYPLDWTFYPSQSGLKYRKLYVEDKHYGTEWFSFNDKKSFGPRKKRR